MIAARINARPAGQSPRNANHRPGRGGSPSGLPALPVRSALNARRRGTILSPST
jgi:hypothetical protein